MIPQPCNLGKQLFNHQLTAIAELEHRESNLEMNHTNYTIYSNLGIYADLIGYGKTLTMVGLVLRDKMNFFSEEPYIHEVITQIYGNGNVVKKNRYRYQRLNTTLIVANQSILKQWWDEFALTPLNVVLVNNRKKCEMIDPQSFNVVLINKTMYNHFVSRFPNYAWKRLIYDEPSFTNIPSMRHIVAGFHWLVTATPDTMLYTNKNPYTYLGSLFAGYIEYNLFQNLIFKNDDDYVRQSIQLPPMKHLYHYCSDTITNLLKDIIPKDMEEMISGGNIEGLIRYLGGTSSTNVFELIEKEKTELIQESQGKIERYERMNDLVRMEKWKLKKLECQKELDEFRYRLENISLLESCYICLDKLTEPIINKCCYNIFCAKCILTWLSKNQSCPLCRKEQDPSMMIHLTQTATCHNDMQKILPQRTKTKIEMIVDILSNKPDGARIIIFSSFDETYQQLSVIIPNLSRLMGRSETRNKTIETFKSDISCPILFLNSIENGAGINLQEATDVILYHQMSETLEAQVIGRCYRVGRTSPLIVHHLCEKN
jgi:SNF2 family DNA or RNA helicase